MIFKTLNSRLLVGFIGMISISTFSILILTKTTMQREILLSQNENARNLVQTIYMNLENSYKSIQIQQNAILERRKIEILNLTNASQVIIDGYFQLWESGILTKRQAQQFALERITNYQNGKNVSSLWVIDDSSPTPQIILNPISYNSSEAEITTHDSLYSESCINSVYQKYSEIYRSDRGSYISHVLINGKMEDTAQHKKTISYVSHFEEWDWIVGTSIIINDTDDSIKKWEKEILMELEESLSDLKIGKEGYLFVFDTNNHFIVHPTEVGADIGVLINPSSGNSLANDLITAAATPNVPYHYTWNKPAYPDDYIFEKMAFVNYFAPLGWYLASSFYMDDIKRPIRIIEKQIFLLSLIFILSSIILSFILSYNLSSSLRKLRDTAESIMNRGIIDTSIPVSGTVETRELGIVLGNMMESLKQTNDQLIHIQKMEIVGSLAGGIAHDFNNMLGGIIGTLSIMKHKLEYEQTLPNRELIEYIKTMENCSQQSSEMVKNLLSLSRKQELNLKNCDLNTILRQVENIYRTSLNKTIDFSIVYPEYIANVWIDPLQIEQVILNLCINAEHAMTIMKPSGEDWGGQLCITLNSEILNGRVCTENPDAKKGAFYIITIQDSGIGMNKQVMSKIFDPFYTTKANKEGTGLGLSLVYSIIHMHQGFITVTSEIGIGSSFNIYLPHSKTEKQPEKNQRIKSTNLKRTGLILIIDDEPAMRGTAAGMLKIFGYSVLHARNGQEGLELFKDVHKEIKAVMLDMNMPGLSAKKVCKKLREIKPHIKVILTSGTAESDKIKSLLKSEADIFIQKPYTLEELGAVIFKITDSTKL